MTRGRKWLVVGGALLAVVLVALLVGRLMLSSRLRTQLVAAISERYGVEATAEDLSMSLFDGTASLNGFRVKDGATTLLEAERVDVQTRVVDVLAGRMDFTKLVVVRPVLRLVVEPDGRTNLGRLLAAPAAGPDTPGPDTVVVLRDARVEDGRIEYDNEVTVPTHHVRMVFRDVSVAIHELQLDGERATPCSADIRIDADLEQPVFPAHLSIVAWRPPSDGRGTTYTLHGVATGYDLSQIPQYVSATQRTAVGGSILHLVAAIEARDGVIDPGAIVGEVDGAGTVLPMRVGGTTADPVFDSESRLGTLLAIPLDRVGRLGRVTLGAGWSALKGGAGAAASVGQGIAGAGAAIGGGVADAAGGIVAGDPFGALAAAGGGVVDGAAKLGSGLIAGLKVLVGLGASAVTELSAEDAAVLAARFRDLHAERRVVMLRAALASVAAGRDGGRRARIEDEIAAATAK